jgi:hypothetical protein
MQRSHRDHRTRRALFFWTGWDAELGDGTFETWKPVNPEPGWDQNPGYLQARAAAGLPD